MKNTLTHNNASMTMLLYANVVLCVVRIVLIIFKNSAELHYLKTTIKIPNKVSFWFSELPRTFLIELFFSLFFQNPFLENLDYRISIVSARPDIVYTYTLNDIMAMANIIRAVLAFRYIKHFSMYNDYSAKRVCGLVNCESDQFFEVRCLIREKPLSAIFWSFSR